MSLRTEDIALVKLLEDALTNELDRQYLDGEIEPDSTGGTYFDAISGEIVGRPNFFKAAQAVIETYWAEEGR